MSPGKKGEKAREDNITHIQTRCVATGIGDEGYSGVVKRRERETTRQSLEEDRQVENLAKIHVCTYESAYRQGGGASAYIRRKGVVLVYCGSL